MSFEIRTETDVAGFEARAGGVASSGPRVLSVADILALDVREPEMLIEGILPAAGASLIVGAAKSGKTLNAVQMAIAVASGTALYDNYRVLSRGPVLVVEQDDPAGEASVKAVLQKSSVSVADIPFHLVTGIPYQFGPDLIAWLEGLIVKLGIRMAVLDSYTALRCSRVKGGDIVKAEQSDMTQLDSLAKRTTCAFGVIHHSSKGSASLDWSEKAAGTYAMSAATESQIFMSRYPELEIKSPERLVRIRGRHCEDLEMVLRFRKDTLDFEYVLEGSAAPSFPLLQQLERTFGAKSFGPKELCHETGISRATAHRQLDKLYHAGVVQKRSYGDYVLVARSR